MLNFRRCEANIRNRAKDVNKIKENEPFIALTFTLNNLLLKTHDTKELGNL